MWRTGLASIGGVRMGIKLGVVWKIMEQGVIGCL